ncbi:helix-turn-helix transcriptional regulator [Phaeacidiphilus oryzae]|jgi:transcriptional regulator with XRE-family HTH domain|uniref:helix-turn-helix transcriptional regulator n=1 Tax=Phaeacidiphilus oryzae TaxID=348818 RepID=UPI00068AC2C3|nr:helix-turn-helix transcriptional regulator [Phaeacidiphilus oryzae]
MTSLSPAPTRLDPDAARRRELADFLRSRRERISPDQVGLPSTGRRRTPGLRREEVAQLAAVGVTWYTWLEQGRDIQVSAQVLDAVARTLRLDPNERGHLFLLAGASDPMPGKICSTVTDPMRLMLDQLEPHPAVVVNSRYDLLAYNRTYAHLLVDLEGLPPEDRNNVWLAFTHPAWRECLPDWESAIQGMVAKLRSAMADHVTEPAWKLLVKRLRAASPEFAEAWDRHEVADAANGVKRIRNPHVGMLHVDYTNLWLGPRHGPRMIVYSPTDEETAQRLERLLEYAVAVEERRGRGAA